MLQRTIHELQVLFPDTHVPLCTHVPLSLTSPYHSRPQNTLTSLRHSRPLIHSRPINAPPLSHSPCHPHPTSGPPARPQYPAAQPGPCTPPALYPPLLLTPPPATSTLSVTRAPRRLPAPALGPSRALTTQALCATTRPPPSSAPGTTGYRLLAAGWAACP